MAVFKVILSGYSDKTETSYEDFKIAYEEYCSEWL